MKNYQVITAQDANTLQQSVQAQLQQGWQLQGGVSVAIAVAPQQMGFFFAQAMVK